jgi:hypothetical protein
MANVQQGIHRDQSTRLLGALLGSARRRHREQLRSHVTSARSTRSDANQTSYEAALHKFRKAEAVDRPTFYQNYKCAISSAERASEAIIRAAIDAGAGDQPIVAYVTDDFCSAVNAFMMTSFGHASEAGKKAKCFDELRLLERNTRIQAQALGQRVPELRAKVDSDRGGAFERFGKWLASGWAK